MVVGGRVSRAQSAVVVRAQHRLGLLGPAVLASLLLATLLVSGAASGAPVDAPRLVLSSSSRPTTARSPSTVSLYSRRDTWNAYLASESVCPGGERSDLPAARQRRTVACLVNFARKQHGVPELAVAGVLSSAAVLKMNAILRCGNFAHNPCGGAWAAEVKAVGYSGSAGENLYLATGRFGAPRATVDAWLNSAPHRNNLLGPAWRQQGLAVTTGENLAGLSGAALWILILGDGVEGR